MVCIDYMKATVRYVANILCKLCQSTCRPQGDVEQAKKIGWLLLPCQNWWYEEVD